MCRIYDICILSNLGFGDSTGLGCLKGCEVVTEGFVGILYCNFIFYGLIYFVYEYCA